MVRTSIYWPNYTEDIKQKVRGCDYCQQTRPSQKCETLIPYEVPAGPWIRLGIDYFEWNGSRYLLIADYCSRFPVLRSVTNMTATNLVTTLKTLFSEYGIPLLTSCYSIVFDYIDLRACPGRLASLLVFSTDKSLITCNCLY